VKVICWIRIQIKSTVVIGLFRNA